ncbi:hypothetical protein F8M41_009132 [Gigaspora margarita]|uniref:MD-2-related lipid-recognition domain-containing protein n=1 Tax=Gigaspora margarita TaxID=4874 RepID=A0A8H4EQQ2_GIGMA|nr:hypothetical protein F8M41_009132 [Gigaspora margarita]
MKNFIFAFILFALLTVNAAPFQLNKRATTFDNCTGFGFVDSLTVKIGTDPPVSGKNESFDVSGKLTKNDITKNQTLLAIAYEDTAGELIADAYIQAFNNSIKAGTQFTISASDVPTPDLPNKYSLIVAVVDPAFEGIIACATANFGVKI